VTTVLVYLWAPIANLLWYLYTVVMATLSLVLWPFDRSGAFKKRTTFRSDLIRNFRTASR